MTSYTADRLAHLNTAEHSFHCNRMNERDTPRQIHNNKNKYELDQMIDQMHKALHHFFFSFKIPLWFNLNCGPPTNLDLMVLSEMSYLTVHHN